MWYPFKFWRNVGYVQVDGRLAEHFGQGHDQPKRRTVRAVDRAKKADGGFLLAVPGGAWEFAAIEGWATRPDHSFRSVTARFVDEDGRDLWVQTSIGHRGALGLLGTWPDGRSPFEGYATATGGCAVDVVQLAGDDSELPQIAGMGPLSDLSSG